MKGDTCFHCRKQGHWIRDCPLKSLPSSASPIKPSDDVPVLRCPCGAGACAVRPSRSERNPDRKFYSCPATSPSCGFFKWCDEVWAPMCPCGAGKCSINTANEPPHRGRKYFGCRVKKGHGACGFFQWVDSYVEILPTRDISTDDHNHFPDVSDFDQDLDGEPLSTLDTRKLDEMLSRVSPGQNINVVVGESLIPNSADQELTVEDINMAHPCAKEMHLYPHRASPSAAHQSQTEVWNQMSTAGDTLTQYTANQLFGIDVLSWCKRLAPFLCCVLPSLEPVPYHSGMDEVDGANKTHQSHAPMESEQNSESLQPSNGNNSLVKHVSHVTNETPASECPLMLTMEDYMGQSMLELFKHTAINIQKEFIGLLKRNPLNHEQLEQAATVCFASLDRLPVESGCFKEQVTKILHCTASLAEIEQSTKDCTLQVHDALEQFNGEKEQLDELSQKHAEALDAFTAYDVQVKGLREDARRIKEMVAKVEEQLRACEVEHVELRSCLREMTERVEETNFRGEGLSGCSRRFNSYMQSKEAERSATTAALAELMLQLRSS